MKKKTSDRITMILILVLLVGLSLLLYPSVSDYWNSFHQSRAIAGYAEEVANLDTDRYDRLWADAIAYNAALARGEVAYTLTDEQRAEYESLLDVSGTGIMGYVEIPGIACASPAPSPSTTVPTTLRSKSPQVIWSGPVSPPAGRTPTASSPATGDSPAPSCSPIWTDWRRGTCSCSACWTRC